MKESPQEKVSLFGFAGKCLWGSRAGCLGMALGLLFTGCQKPLERKMMLAVEQNATVERDGILYDAESNETVSGYVKDSSDEGVRILYKVSKGKRNGEFLGFYPNGIKSVQGSFRDGNEHGLWTTWDENGTKQWEGNREDGVLHGRVTRWFQSGSKKTEGVYEKGHKEGEETVWHRNGRIWQRRSYVRGKKEGHWTYWDKEGRLLKEEVYRDDQLIDGKKHSNFWLQPDSRAPAPASPPAPQGPSE